MKLPAISVSQFKEITLMSAFLLDHHEKRSTCSTATTACVEHVSVTGVAMTF